MIIFLKLTIEEDENNSAHSLDKAGVPWGQLSMSLAWPETWTESNPWRDLKMADHWRPSSSQTALTDLQRKMSTLSLSRFKDFVTEDGCLWFLSRVSSAFERESHWNFSDTNTAKSTSGCLSRTFWCVIFFFLLACDRWGPSFRGCVFSTLWGPFQFFEDFSGPFGQRALELHIWSSHRDPRFGVWFVRVRRGGVDQLPHLDALFGYTILRVWTAPRLLLTLRNHRSHVSDTGFIFLSLSM